MSELLNERVKNSVGKTVLIFLHNNFRYEGKVTGCDDVFLEILDFKTNSYKIIALGEIKEVEVRG